MVKQSHKSLVKNGRVAKGHRVCSPAKHNLAAEIDVKPQPAKRPDRCQAPIPGSNCAPR